MVDGDNEIKCVVEVCVGGKSLVFAESDKGVVNPVSDWVETGKLIIMFEDFSFEKIYDSLWEEYQIMVDMLVNIWFVCEFSLIYCENVFEIMDINF